MIRKEITPSSVVSIIQTLNKISSHMSDKNEESLFKSMKFYIKLARTTLWKFSSPLLEEEFKKIGRDTLFQLKELLIKANEQLRTCEMISKKTKEKYNKFQRFIEMTHLSLLRLIVGSKWKESGEKDELLFRLFLRINLSLLRHIDQLRFDKICLDVGSFMPEFGDVEKMNEFLKNLPGFTWENVISIEYSVYDLILLVSEFIDKMQIYKEGDHNGFVKEKEGSFNRIFHLPRVCRIPNAKIYDVDIKFIDYCVTNIIVNTEIADDEELVFKKDKCKECKKENIFWNLECEHCNHKHEACCVTGFRIRENERVKCRICTKSSNKDDWEIYMKYFKVCPYCGDNQSYFDGNYRDLNARIEFLFEKLNDENWKTSTYGLEFPSRRVKIFQFLK